MVGEQSKHPGGLIRASCWLKQRACSAFEPATGQLTQDHPAGTATDPVIGRVNPQPVPKVKTMDRISRTILAAAGTANSTPGIGPKITT